MDELNQIAKVYLSQCSHFVRDEHVINMANEFYSNHEKEIIESSLCYESVLDVLDFYEDNHVMPRFIIEDSVSLLQEDLNEMNAEWREHFGED